MPNTQDIFSGLQTVDNELQRIQEPESDLFQGLDIEDQGVVTTSDTPRTDMLTTISGDKGIKEKIKGSVGYSELFKVPFSTAFDMYDEFGAAVAGKEFSDNDLLNLSDYGLAALKGLGWVIRPLGAFQAATIAPFAKQKEIAEVEKKEGFLPSVGKALQISGQTLLDELFPDAYGMRENLEGQILEAKIPTMPDWLKPYAEISLAIMTDPAILAFPFKNAIREGLEVAAKTGQKVNIFRNALEEAVSFIPMSPEETAKAVKLATKEPIVEILEKPTKQVPIKEINELKEISEDVAFLGEELLDNNAKIFTDGTVRVYHRSTPENIEQIKKTGLMKGKEPQIFFSTKKDGQAIGYGKATVALDIPIEKLALDDVFGNEAHVAILQPTRKPLNVQNWLVKADKTKAVSFVPMSPEDLTQARRLAVVADGKDIDKAEPAAKELAELVTEKSKEAQYYTPKPTEIPELKTPEKQIKFNEDFYKRNRDLPIKTRVNARRKIREIRKDVGKVTDRALGVISTRLKNINPELKYKLREYEFNTGKKISEDIKTAEPLFKKVRKFSKEDRADFDLARKNSDTKKIDELVAKYGVEKEHAELRTTLDNLYQEAKNVGFDVEYRKNYYPRVVKDPEGLLAYFQKGKDWAIIQDAIRAKELQLDRYMTVEEKADFINAFIRGYAGDIKLAKPGAFKGRKIEAINADLNKFYMDSDAATIQYMRRIQEAIEARKFFGKSLITDNALDIENSIGGYVLKLLDEGKIKPEHEKELTNILKARFNPKGPGAFVGAYRNLAYIDTMGSPISAITQIGDLAFSLYKAGVKKTASGVYKAIKGKPLLKKEDIGIENIAQEFSDSSTFAKAVSNVFKIIGLEKIDAIGKETLIYATITRKQMQARTLEGVAKLRTELQPIFKGETDQVIKDLANGEITENVKLLAFNELADVQPIALSEMPELYVTGGNGRIFYMLKTFFIKQFDVFRNEAFQKMASPHKSERIEGIRNLIKLTAALTIMNTTADVIKDTILGRQAEPKDYAVDNILRIVGFSRYITWQARTEGFAKAALKQILPPVKFPDAVVKDALSLGDNQGFELMNDVPLGGKLYYWWFGKGRSKLEARAKRKGKERKKPF